MVSKTLCWTTITLVSTYLKVEAKVVETRRTFWNKGPDWEFLAKFGYDIGRGNFVVEGRLPFNASVPRGAALTLELYLDEDWEAALDMPDPCERSRFAKGVYKLAKKGNLTRLSRHGSMEQAVRPHVWYFVISSCDSMGTQEPIDVALKLSMQNAHGNEFDVNMKGSLAASLASASLTFGFSLFGARRCHQLAVDLGGLHPVVFVLAIAIVIHFAAQVCYSGHLLVYQDDGVGLKNVVVVSECLWVISQFVLAVLLLSISCGYTLTDDQMPKGLQEVVVLTFAATDIAFAVGGVLTVDEWDRHSAHDGSRGFVSSATRLVMCWRFWDNCGRTLSRTSFLVGSFLRQFQFSGAFYFLSYPSMLFVSRGVASYWSSAVLDFGNSLTQLSSFLWLSSLFLSKGRYFMVSSLGDTPLPGSWSPPSRYCSPASSPATSPSDTPRSNAPSEEPQMRARWHRERMHS